MLPAVGLVTTAFGVSVVSAVFSVISAEVFVVGVVLAGSALPWWLLAGVIATGQMGGKLLHYYSARGLLRRPWFLHRKITTPGGLPCSTGSAPAARIIHCGRSGCCC